MELEQVQTLLEARRRHLADELAELTKPPEAGSNLSFGKRIGEGTTEAVERISSTAAARSIAATLAEVDRPWRSWTKGTTAGATSAGSPSPPRG
jgi:DnaK suppressor protein